MSKPSQFLWKNACVCVSILKNEMKKSCNILPNLQKKHHTVADVCLSSMKLFFILIYTQRNYFIIMTQLACMFLNLSAVYCIRLRQYFFLSLPHRKKKSIYIELNLNCKHCGPSGISWASNYKKISILLMWLLIHFAINNSIEENILTVNYLYFWSLD